MNEWAGARPTVVWCDFGGVLTPPVAEAAAAIARSARIDWSTLWAAIREVAAAEGLDGLQPLELGRITQREWGVRVAAALPAGVRPAIDLGDWGEHWYRGRTVDGDLLALLGELRASGVRVGMLTNSVREWEPYRARMLGAGVTVFEAVVRSHVVGAAKPDRRIYEAAEQTLLRRDGTALLIDDSGANCAAARRFGWRAHHHRDRRKTLGLVAALAAGAPDVPASDG